MGSKWRVGSQYLEERWSERASHEITGRFSMDKRDLIVEIDDEILMLPTEFDGAIIGVSDDIVVYDEDKVVEVLIENDGMSFEDAAEFYAYNIKGSLGKGYPTYVSVL